MKIADYKAWTCPSCVFIISLLSVVPIWLFDFLPFQDLPTLMSDVAILMNYTDARYGYDRYYDIDVSLYGYWGFAAPVYALNLIFSLETATRLAISLFAVALPLSVMTLVRSLGRDPWVALMAVPLTYNYSLYMGFLTFLFALPFFFWAMACWYRVFGHADLKSKQGVVLIGSAILLSFLTAQCHVIVGGLLSASVLGICLSHPLGRSKVLLLAPLGLTILGPLVATQSSDALRSSYGAESSVLTITWTPIWQSTENLFTKAFYPHVSWIGTVANVSYFALLTAMTIGTLSSVRHSSVRWSCPAFVFVLVAYFAIPEGVGSTYYLSSRMISVCILLFLASLASRELKGIYSKLFRAGALLVAALHTAATGTLLADFQTRTEGFHTIVQQASWGKRTLYLPFEFGNEGRDAPAALIHFDALIQVYRGGDVGHAGARYSNDHLTYKPGMMAPSPDEDAPVLFKWNELRTYYDRLLIYGKPSDYHGMYNNWLAIGAIKESEWKPPSVKSVEDEIGRAAREAVRTVRAGRWTMYEFDRQNHSSEGVSMGGGE